MHDLTNETKFLVIVLLSELLLLGEMKSDFEVMLLLCEKIEINITIAT